MVRCPRRSGAIRHVESFADDLCDGASWFYSGVDSAFTSEGTGAIAVNKACRVSAPVVSFVAEDNSAVTSGYSVTVSGMNFAVSATTPTSTIGLSSCATAAWASASSVVCMLSMGEGVSHELRMTVAGVVGSRTATFSYDGKCVIVVNVGCLRLISRVALSGVHTLIVFAHSPRGQLCGLFQRGHHGRVERDCVRRELRRSRRHAQ